MRVLDNRRWAASLIFFVLLLTSFHSVTASAEDGPTVANVAPDVVKLHLVDKTDIRFRRLQGSEGLSQTRVAQIIQDEDGYIWFGTQNGVSRYDGYRFQVLKHIQDDPDSLSGIYIYDLFKDRSGTVWVASDQFLDAFDRQTGKFRHYRIEPDSPTVIHISQDADDALWLSTDNGLYRFDIKTGQTKLYSHDPNDPRSLASNSVKFSGVDREGTFWVADGEGVEAFDRSTGKVTIRIPIHEEVREFGFHEDAHGVFWITSSAGNGLSVYDRKSNTLIRYSFDDVPAESGLSGVHSILETTNGDIWLATMGSGLLKFDRDKFQFERYRNDPTDAESLKENRAISLFEDREGNIWAGLHASPPVMFPREKPMFRTLWPSPGHVDAMGGESLVNSVFEDRQGAVWLGAGAALNRLDAEGKIRVFTPGGPGTSVEVLSIAEDAAGALWIGTLGSGLYKFDPATETFTSFKYSADKPDGISSDTVTRIYVEPSGMLWLSTWNGFDSFDPASGKFTTYKANPGSGYEAYFSIAPDGDQFWLGTTEGFGRFDRKDHSFKVYKHDPDDRRSISNNTVDTVFLGSDGAIWIGTQNGLNRFDKKTEHFQSFFESDGLAGNAVSCILGDQQGQLWMSTNQGISRLDTSQMRFDNYSTEDGLPGDDLTGWDACSVGKSGKLYFGGFAGATVRNSDGPSNDHVMPPVVLTDIQVGDGPKLAVPSSTFLQAVEPVIVPSTAQFLTVGFSAPTFRSPKGTRYRYQLAGFEDVWHTASSNERTVSFAALPPGDFTLRIEAASKRGEWNSGVTALQMTVMPKWWQTWWFMALLAAAIILSLVAAYRYRLSQIAAHYDLRFRERMNERNRVARDLHDTLLQSIQGLSFHLHAARNLLPAKPADAANLLDVVLRKSDEAVLEGRNAVQALRDVKQTDADIVEALRAVGIELALEHPSPAPEFDIRSFGKPVAPDAATREEIYRIAAEALRNAFKHSGATLIECSLHYAADQLRIVVSDNGEGMSSSAGQSSGARGWGIAGMKERANKIGGHLVMESVSGKGTTVELQVSLNAKSGRPPWRLLGP